MLDVGIYILGFGRIVLSFWPLYRVSNTLAVLYHWS